MKKNGIAFVILILAMGAATAAAAVETVTAVVKSKSACNDSTFDPVVQIPVPGHPFGVLSTADGCRVFVSITEPDPEKPAGIEIFKRDHGRISHYALAPIENGHPLDMVMTHDEKILIVADQNDVVFFDAKKLDVSNPASVISQAQLGRLKYGDNVGSIYVNVTSDDRFLFVADERAKTITVVDLKKAVKNKFNADSVVGRIATGNSPVALAFSPDQTKLYATSEFGPRVSGWPVTCSENANGGESGSRRGLDPQGAVLVIDVKKAEVDPANSLLAAVPSGCSPVRLVLSPDGKEAYVSARSDGDLLVFDTGKLMTDPAHAQIGRVPLGAPIGLAVINGGADILVANLHSLDKSEAFKNQELALVDTSKIDDNADAKIGAIATGAYPRELRTSTDANTLFLTNFNSNSIEVIDLRRLPDILKNPVTTIKGL